MFDLTMDQSPRYAMYCPFSGTRLAPRDANTPATPSFVAVAVFDDGSTVPILGDTLFGRQPGSHRRVAAGDWSGWEVDDPSGHMSRVHTLLRVHDWELEVIDMGSRNGTAVRVGDDDEWQQLMPGIGYRVGERHTLRMGSRTFKIHHAVR